MKPSPDSPALETYLLGHVDFQEVQSLQRRIVYELGERGGASPDPLRAPADHQRRRSGSRAHILPDDDWLSRPWVSGSTGSTAAEVACCIFPARSPPTLPCPCARRH